MGIVLRRCAWLGFVIVVLVLPSASLPAPSPPPPVLARSIYVVRPDPRLCPSPLCGGYWVSRANHSRTRCYDRMFRPRCYIATAFSELTRKPLTIGLPADGLVRAAVGSRTFPGLGELGTITVTEMWKPLGPAQPTGDFLRVRDIGVRCVRAPCFSLRAWQLNRAFRITVSGLDLSRAKLVSDQVAQAEAALTMPNGLVVAGRIVPAADGGRDLRASQVYFRVATPRA